MRIHRIKLEDFRGVRSVDVSFEADGVTIVEGPNETGKTSLADAFDMLLTQKDSSGKRQIKAAQPIGRDVGPFVEAELSLGSYRLVYRKRWLRGRMTELHIVEPTAEQLVGEDAHNRMSTILESETDQVLFAALRYQQGSEISQAAIAEAPSLVAALDTAAGGGEHDPAGAGKSDALVDLIDKERLKFFTPGGKVLSGRLEARQRLEALGGEVTAIETATTELDQAAESLDQIVLEIAELEEKGPVLDTRIVERTTELEVAEAVERSVSQARQRLELAEASLADANAKQEGRVTLVDAQVRAENTLADVARNIAAGTSDLDSASKRVEEAQRGHQAAAEAVDTAVAAAKSDREALDLLDLSFLRDDLRERQRLCEEAEAEIVDAESFLAGTVIDAEMVARLDELETESAVTAARAEAGQARLVIEALKPLDLQLDADVRRVEPGCPVETGVVAQTVALIDDLARVIVTPAQDSAAIEDEAIRVRGELRDLLQVAGVDSASAAHDLLGMRLRRESDRDNARRRRKEALKDLEPAELTAKLERAGRRLDEHAEGHPAIASTPAAFEEARLRLGQGEQRLEEARARADRARQDLLAAEAALRVLEDKRIADRTRREAAEEEAERTRGELATARSTVGDDEIGRAVEDARERVAAAEAAREKAEAELEASDPGTVRVTLDNDRELKKRLADDLGALRVDEARVREQLRLGGLEGLSDRRAETLAELAELDRKVAAEDRLAAAAEYLYELLIERREQAKQAYVGPFADKVNFYARIIFGPNVRIEIDPSDFSLAARTLEGTNVPFDWLSGGTREQLAVLARLACAALVGPAGDSDSQQGVPVIIDDALGYSDPARLRRLGAAFSAAGKDCQVIVLTCEPGRYRDIGGATVVPLERGPVVAKELAELSA
jgi:hypothetical protein